MVRQRQQDGLGRVGADEAEDNEDDEDYGTETTTGGAYRIVHGKDGKLPKLEKQRAGAAQGSRSLGDQR